MKMENQKTAITAAEFDKRVEIEAQHLMYFNHMKREKAFEQARQEIAEKYDIQ